jgi:fatty acid desaturase
MAPLSSWCVSVNKKTDPNQLPVDGSVPAKISAREAKSLVDDLFPLVPAIYWIDLLLSTTLAYGSAAFCLQTANFSLQQGLTFVISGIALFRITTFMHEIAHMRRSEMRAFKLVWNLLVGIPLLTPSLFYTTHADHHSNRHYGTPDDGEYLPFGATEPSTIFRFIAAIPFIPILAVIRALLLVPLSLLVPRLRIWLLARASAAVINPTYKRRHAPKIWDPVWLVTDLACFAYTACAGALVLNGSLTLRTLGILYALILFAIALNWLRTLAAHRYRNNGSEVSHTNQVLDSINIIGSPLLTEFLYPVGLRYHALHHLLPSLPYHALGKAHRRLMLVLPADSLYRQASCSSTVAALRQLWRDAKSSEDQGSAIRQQWRQT